MSSRDDAGRSRVKVLYIVGAGRSGSTLLANLLGEMEGFFSAGELRQLWQRGLVEGRRCGCGEPIESCPLWTEVVQRTLAATPEVRPPDIVRWQRESVRLRHTRAWLRDDPLLPGKMGVNGARAAYGRLQGRLYQAVWEVSGADVVVDSSKAVAGAAVLRSLAGVTAYYVHLVRDPRGVAFSWRRHKAQPDRREGGEMVRFGPGRSAVNWLATNIAAESLLRRTPADRFLRVRYEDLMEAPRSALASIASLVGEPAETSAVIGERRARFGRNHTVSGNPVRFTDGEVELREDDEWRDRMSMLDRFVVTTTALPVLHRYGYPVRPGPRSGFIRSPDRSS